MTTMSESDTVTGHNCYQRYVFIFLLSLSLNVQSTYCIKCYTCTSVAPPLHSNKTVRICSKFDYSDKFIEDCPYSTMCLKKYTEYPLQNGDLITGEVRGCAPQKFEYQELKNREWTLKARVEEAYTEGCQFHDDRLVSARSMYCYCRDALCNSSPQLQGTQLAYHNDVIAVIIVFNVMKYMQSL